MNKKHIVPIALIVVILGGTLAIRLWPRTLTAEQCSEVYQKYVGRDDIQATFIKDKRINDSIAVNMTMLSAAGDSGWAVLQHDFNMPVIPKEYEEYFYADTNQLSLKLVPKKNPSLPMDSIISNNDLVATSYSKRLICIFSIENTSQLKAILRDSYDNNVSLKQ
ncbi:MAG: hypothetical protein IJ745_00335 [Bacteroidales bacterium]|nr:hypothetical protein [Bacteroidales bacterium]